MPDNFAIEIAESSRVTFIDKSSNNYWSNWKNVLDCTPDEIRQVNLATPHPKYILLDKDFKDADKDQIDAEYERIKQKLEVHAIDNWIADRSRQGFHIFIPTTNLASLDPDIQKEVRTIYIDEFKCDKAKSSALTAIALPNKPHFKTGITYGIIEEKKGEVYTVKDTIIGIAKERVESRGNILQKLEADKDFENYFEDDPFFKYIRDNAIPENSNRNITILPNLAIAAVKSGKTREDIKTLVKPIIDKNFPGKSYAEFDGWLKKAFRGEITVYNFYQLNSWMREYSIDKKALYDMTVSLQSDLKQDIVDKEVEEEQSDAGEKFKFYWDGNLESIKNSKTEWLIDKWLPKGDICMFVGKSASFKTTLCMHMAYAVASGKSFLNQYSSLKTNVLYINEENPASIMVSMSQRVKKGMGLEDFKSNVCFSILENIKLDDSTHLMFLIDFINKNDIGLVVFDSFRRGITFDENNATEMNQVYNNLKIFRKNCNDVTIVLLHHLKKANAKFAGDIRDSIRGSSDIVNNADSVIGVQRKSGSKMLQLEQIKCRSGEEMSKRLVIMESGEDNDMAYFFESDKVLDSAGAINQTDKCAEDVMTWSEKTNNSSFARKDLPDKIIDSYSKATLTRAFKSMIDDGVLNREGSGAYVKYTITKLVTSGDDS